MILLVVVYFEIDRWFLCNIMMEIKHFRRLFEEHHTSSPNKYYTIFDKNQTKSSVRKLEKLKFSESVQPLMDVTIEAVLNTLTVKYTETSRHIHAHIVHLTRMLIFIKLLNIIVAHVSKNQLTRR